MFQSSCSLNTPKIQSCLPEVIPDQIRQSPWRRTQSPLCVHAGQRWEVSGQDQWLLQRESDSRSIPSGGHWPCTQWQHMATPGSGTDSLTYSRSSITNLHHLLRCRGRERSTGHSGSLAVMHDLPDGSNHLSYSPYKKLSAVWICYRFIWILMQVLFYRNHLNPKRLWASYNKFDHYRLKQWATIPPT